MIKQSILKFASAAFVTAMLTGTAMANDPSNDASVKAYSKSTEKKVIVQPAPVETNLLTYDLNGNGVLEPHEVGEKLFYQFDRDGNEALDNIEFNKELQIDFAPMEKTQIISVDFDNDGVIEDQVVEKDIIMQKTGLERFDTDGDNGMTPREFIGQSLLQLDLDGSGLVELDEWKKAYIDQMSPKASNNAIYND